MTACTNPSFAASDAKPRCVVLVCGVGLPFWQEKSKVRRRFLRFRKPPGIQRSAISLSTIFLSLFIASSCSGSGRKMEKKLGKGIWTGGGWGLPCGFLHRLALLHRVLQKTFDIISYYMISYYDSISGERPRVNLGNCGAKGLRALSFSSSLILHFSTRMICRTPQSPFLPCSSSSLLLAALLALRERVSVRAITFPLPALSDGHYSRL